MRATVAALLAALAISPAPSELLPALPAPTPVTSPAQRRAGMPQLTEHNGQVLLSWIEVDGDVSSLRFAEREGAGWSAPRTVASGPDWFVNWADVPSVLRLGDTRLAAHWLQKSGPDTYAYDVRLSFSADNGATWSPPTTPHHDGTLTEHGFASLFREPAGGLGLIWLDGRAMTPGGHGHGGGAMTARAASFNSDGRQISETLVDDRVCECCPTAAAVTTEGVVIAYRDRAAGEVRDIYASRRTNGTWSAPAAVFADRWVFPACPVNGPAIDALDRTVVVSWFTMRDGVGRSYAAFSKDAGRTFGTPVPVDDGVSLGRADVELLEGGRAVVAWLEFVNEHAEWRLRLVNEAGERGPATTAARVTSSRSSGYPRMARQKDMLVLAWADAGAEPPTIRTALVPLR
jgi:hypothetical protein